MNLDVTSPAATLALGLMFLRTNDAAIAAAFTLPDTHFALDYVRPDFIMLRVLAKSLVMQDSVQASKGWVEDQMPPLIKARQHKLDCNSVTKLKHSLQSSATSNGALNLVESNWVTRCDQIQRQVLW